MTEHTPIPLSMLTEKHLRTAVQALAYLLAFNSVTKQESVFDAEREAALAVIRDNYAPIIEACNAHAALVEQRDQTQARLDAMREVLASVVEQRDRMQKTLEQIASKCDDWFAREAARIAIASSGERGK